jgi:hypothetical protein
MSRVIELEPFREKRLAELTRRAIKLPRYRRLVLMVALCERLREGRRLTRHTAKVVKHPHSG